MRELFGFINSYIFSPLSLDGRGMLFGLFFVVPALFGLVVTLGDWKAVLKAFLIWYGGLFAAFFLMSGKLADTLHGTLLYAMFFSVLAVPCLALLLKLRAWIKTRARPMEPAR